MQVPIYYIPQFAEQLELRGVDIADWLATAGITMADMCSSQKSLSLSSYRILLENALTLSGEPGLGLLVGRSLAPSAHGIVGFAATSSASIAEALKVATRFIPLRTPLVSVQTQIKDDLLQVILRPAPDLQGIALPVMEIALTAIKNIADHMVVTQTACTHVFFAFPEPDYINLAKSVFNCPVSYNAPWSGMVFPLETACTPLSQHDGLVLEEALRICQAELERLTASGTLQEKLERLILERQGEFMSLDRAAQMLNLTPRTLHRRLVAEGTSYQEILDRLRQRLAHQYLCVERISVKETAYLLGYNDIANFRRAFKRWEGRPPSAVKPALFPGK